MKKKDLNDIRKKSIKQINSLLSKKREELDKIKVDVALGQESNLKKASNIRKDIAQMLTIIREKEIVREMQKDETNNKKGDKE